MIITRVWSDEAGESHAEDLEVPMDQANNGFVSQMMNVEGVIFSERDFNGPRPYHNARWRHLCVCLVGAFELECTDGTKKVIEPGRIMLGEDVTGRGHASIELATPRLTVFIPVPDDFDTSTWKVVG